MAGYLLDLARDSDVRDEYHRIEKHAQDVRTIIQIGGGVKLLLLLHTEPLTEFCTR